jgi:hypothetical protein
MHNGYRFIDSDAHVLEPADMFEKGDSMVSFG